MHLWLSTGLDAGDPITHGVKASLSWVRFDDDFKRFFTSFKLLFPVDALGLAKIEYEGFSVHASVIHGGLRVNSNVHPVRVVICRREVQS